MNHKKQALYYLQGLLSERQIGRFESHLNNCPLCSMYVKNLKKIDKVIAKGRLKKIRKNDFDRAKLISRITQGEQSDKKSVFKLFPRLKWALASVIIIIIISLCYFNVKKPLNVLSCRGEVYIQAGAQKKIIHNNEKLSPGQIIITGKASECYLNFGGNIIYLGSNSQVLLQKLTREVRGYFINLDIKRGLLLFNINDKKSISRMLVKAGDTIACVKGTIFMIDRTQGMKQSVAVLKGELLVKKNNKKFSLPSMQKLTIQKEKISRNSLSYLDEIKFYKILKFDLYFIPRWQEKLKNYEYIKITGNEQNYYIISMKGDVLALDKKSGKPVWEVKLGPELNSEPVLYDRSLYITSSDGYIYCVSDGEIRLREKLGPFVYSSPLIYDKKIYFANTKGYIYALSLDTKKILGEKRLDAPVYSTPVIKNDKLYIGTISGRLYCLDIFQNFKIIWEQQLEGRIIDNPPVFYYDNLFIGTFAGNLYTLSSVTGGLIRTIQVDGEIDSPLVLKENIVFVRSKKFYAFNINGIKKWEREINFNDEIFYQNENILVENDNRIVYINHKDGSLKKYYTKDPVFDILSFNDRIFSYDGKYIRYY